MQCPEALRTQAYFDGEVDALASSEVERHMESCAACRELLRDLERTRAMLRSDVPHLRASAALRARICDALDKESSAEAASQQPARARPSPRRPFWLGAASGVSVSAMAAALVMLLVLPRFNNPLIDEVVDAHIRSLMPDHLIDVPSSDRHTVKPWFAGHADISPPVADFAPQGYRLAGGRSDYLDHQRAAAVVYQHGAHVINLFSWAATGHALPSSATRNGYHLLCWRARDIDSCAVSDTGWDELRGFVRLVQDLNANDRPQEPAGKAGE
jgi:anti-sigma factor RsiW